uniref:Family with sequence similarity 216 member A n=1 Tax=Molossus molossus TaxID=27622 RepID=A0A7J8BWZ1_MOLMO|nr:family with sequence similarity 216 member A [Molossus molossus]
MCPARSPEAIRAGSGAQRRGLPAGIRLFAPSIARPDASVPTPGGKRGELPAPSSPCQHQGGDARPGPGVRLAGLQLFCRAACSGQDRGWRRRISWTVSLPEFQRSHLSSCHSQKQHYPCTTWRHQLERGDSGSSNTTAASAPEMIIQHSLWRPVRNKGGLKTGYASKTRCKSLKIFRKPGRLFMQSVSTNDFESFMNEEKKEDLLSKCMQSMSIEEQGEHLMLT